MKMGRLTIASLAALMLGASFVASAPPPGPQDPPNPAGQLPPKKMKSSNTEAHPEDANIPVPAAQPALDDNTIAAVRHALQIPDSEELDFVWDQEVGGYTLTRDHAKGVSASARASGTDLKQKIETTAPTAETKGGGKGGGGDSNASQEGNAFIPPVDPNLWTNPLLWIGVAIILAGVGVFSLSGMPIVNGLQLRRPAFVLWIVGIAFVCGAAWPNFAKFWIGAGCLVAICFYIWSEIQERRNKATATTTTQVFDRVIAGVQKGKEYAAEAADKLREQVAILEKHNPGSGAPALALIDELQSAFIDALSEKTDTFDRKFIDTRKEANKLGRFNPGQ